MAKSFQGEAKPPQFYHDFGEGKSELSVKKNVRSSVCVLKLKHKWDLQHKSNCTSEKLKKNRVKGLERPSKSLDLNPIEILWQGRKRAAHAHKASNMAEKRHLIQTLISS